jgi:hypothetical protein
MFGDKSIKSEQKLLVLLNFHFEIGRTDTNFGGMQLFLVMFQLCHVTCITELKMKPSNFQHATALTVSTRLQCDRVLLN